MGLTYPAEWAARRQEICASRLRNEDAYWFVDSLADLEEEWPRIMVGHPGIIKIMLMRTDSFAPNTCERSTVGVSPEVARAVVLRARAEGLEVAAHIETARDFEEAVRAGVRLMAHMPGYNLENRSDPARYTISREAAILAREAGVIVNPTLRLSEFLRPHRFNTGQAASGIVRAERDNPSRCWCPVFGGF